MGGKTKQLVEDVASFVEGMATIPEMRVTERGRLEDLARLKEGDKVVVEIGDAQTKTIVSSVGRKYIYAKDSFYKFYKSDGRVQDANATGRMYTPKGYELELRRRGALHKVEGAIRNYVFKPRFEDFSCESLEAIAAIIDKEWGE